MTEETVAIALAIVCGMSGLYFLGQSLIEAYFRRKEKFVETLNNKLKGGSNGSVE